MPADPPDNDKIRLVVGLGNPGAEYEGTRHNVGFELMDRLAEHYGLEWTKERKFKAMVAKKGSELILVKPLTFMNLSGVSVAKFTGFFKVPATGLLIAYDDISLPLGSMRFRASGSAGGHNGIKSIIQSLGHEKFPRLKVGIGESGGQGRLIGHVLGRFEADEKEDLEKTLAIAVEGVSCALDFGLDAAMNRFNLKAKTRKKKAEENKPSPDIDERPDHETEV